jgi:hypothetical protein
MSSDSPPIPIIRGYALVAVQDSTRGGFKPASQAPLAEGACGPANKVQKPIDRYGVSTIIDASGCRVAVLEFSPGVVLGPFEGDIQIELNGRTHGAPFPVFGTDGRLLGKITFDQEDVAVAYAKGGTITISTIFGPDIIQHHENAIPASPMKARDAIQKVPAQSAS